MTSSHVFETLAENDILFIDSSHETKAGNDVQFLYFDVLPRLQSGVLVHIHDIFLPFEYPKRFLDSGYPWREAYLVEAMLLFGNAFEVVWAGHHLQRTLKGFAEHFPNIGNRAAQSLWLRKRG